MMFRYAIMASLLLAVPGSPAVAKDEATTEESKPDPNKVLCRREVPTGSVMAKKVCRTRAQWDAIAQASQEDLNRTRDMERSRSTVAGNRGL